MDVTILHISDLHRDPYHPLKNTALIESLARDRDRYCGDDKISISTIDVILVTGDIVSGVQPTDPHKDLDDQYAEAQSFLNCLVEEFIEGDKRRLVVVPGNHDVSYPHVMDSLRQIDIPSDPSQASSLIASLREKTKSAEAPIRWRWSDLTFYEVHDRKLYDRRFEPFSQFYRGLYDDLRQYPVAAEEQFDLFTYATIPIAVAAFSSCHNNDPLNRVAAIHPDTIGAAYRQLRKGSHRHALRLGVWHHSTRGSPYQSDYLDRDVLQVLIDCGFSLGFHGHQHKSSFIEEYCEFGEKKRIVVISAGTLCGGAASLPMGRRRTYNLVQLNTETGEGLLHIREMANEDLASPVWTVSTTSGRDKSGRPFIFDPGKPTEIVRGQIVAAEELIGRREYSNAIPLLKPIYRNFPLARKLLLECYLEEECDREIAEDYWPPESASEAIAVMDALWELGDRIGMRKALELKIIHDSGDPFVRKLAAIYEKRLLQ
jgi:hypothetical protein